MATKLQVGSVANLHRESRRPILGEGAKKYGLTYNRLGQELLEKKLQDLINMTWLRSNDDISKSTTGEPYTRNEMIILEDSDLYAVINCLIITDHFPLYKIWVQKRVHEKFVWLMKNYRSTLSITIDTFQSVKDIQFLPYDNIISIVSIWSEDIVAAKNLALSINSHVVFINTYMDFYGSILLWIYKHISMQSRRNTEWVMNNITHQNEPIIQNQESSTNVVHLSSIIKINDISVGNLFYDGAWQKPIKSMYWKHNDSFWANATHTDIKKCYQSANKGFKTWSNMSMKARIQILSRFISILKLNGKFVLAAIVERWMRFPYLYESIRGHIENDMIEILQTHIPLGVIILREENENILFFRLMQTLIAGNSVIVMFDANFCNLSSHYDMFSKCGIPPGVINLLSHENTSTLEFKLCLEDYATYANRYFLKGTSKEAYVLPFKRLTITKRIIIPLQ
ncbi:uncharacterized protein [Mycetomoellerius zeteki]|uniref:uncharacterized protein n=1 Tax=Mycetomoellerius zeteki TaxID=64791 RepID=UPI00084E8359|nr:PREDICTED: uncharacterized protein LOC108724226 [Trachymyrmex zeteki]